MNAEREIDLSPGDHDGGVALTAAQGAWTLEVGTMKSGRCSGMSARGEIRISRKDSRLESTVTGDSNINASWKVGVS